MINWLHSVLYRPENGWDPVPLAHAVQYADHEWHNINVPLIDKLEECIGGFSGKRVLDLGGGPGQYSVAFAKRGAQVVWHDVSRNYLDVVQNRERGNGVRIEFSLGYLEDSVRFRGSPFDFVFCRIAWCYCRSDRAFARLIYSLVKPGMCAYIDNNTPELERELSLQRRLIYLLNNRFGWKVGHPHPPHGRIASLLLKYPMDYVVLDYTSKTNDRVFFRKCRDNAL